MSEIAVPVKKYIFLGLSLFLSCLCIGLFIQPGWIAEKIVDWRISVAYQKEVQEMYSLVYGQLEAQDAVDMIDSYMDIFVPEIQRKYYETCQAEAKRVDSISQLQTAIRIVSAGFFFVGIGGTVWNIRKQRTQ